MTTAHGAAVSVFVSRARLYQWAVVVVEFVVAEIHCHECATLGGELEGVVGLLLPAWHCGRVIDRTPG